ncbi:MAG: hypothetical protein AB7U44_07125, partial [Sulfuricurvum sp.]
SLSFLKKLHPLGENIECDFFLLKYLIIEQVGLLSNLVWNYWGATTISSTSSGASTRTLSIVSTLVLDESTNLPRYKAAIEF